MLKKIAHGAFACVLIVHSLIHLGIIPGGLQEPDGRTGWSGASWLLDRFLDTSAIRAIGVVLITGTMLFFVIGALGLLGIPLLRGRWKAATIAASILSLLLFAVTWNGILPHPSDAFWGPIISGVLLAGLLIVSILERTILRTRPPLKNMDHSRQIAEV